MKTKVQLGLDQHFFNSLQKGHQAEHSHELGLYEMSLDILWCTSGVAHNTEGLRFNTGTEDL